MDWTKKTRLILILVLGFSLIEFGLSALPQLGFTTFDDAYTFLRYAQHWLSGYGFTWNTSDPLPTYGATSLLYLLLVTLLRGSTHLSAGLLVTAASFAAGLAAAAAFALIGYLTLRSKNLRSAALPLLAAVFLIAAPSFEYHSLSGMDTTLALLTNALLAAATAYLLRSQSNFAVFICALCGLLTLLARPDNGLYALLIPPLALATNGARPAWRLIAVYLFLFVLGAALDCALNVLLLGQPLPLSFYAKSTAFYRGYLGGYKWNAVKELFVFLRDASPFILLLILYQNKRSRGLVLAVMIPILLTFAYLLGVTQIMGWHGRYYFTALPFLALASFLTVDRFAANDSEAPIKALMPPRLNVLICLAVVALFFRPTIDNSASALWQRYVIRTPRGCQINSKFISARLPALGWWSGIQALSRLLARAPKGTSLAATEHGLISAEFPDLKIFDLTGLHNNELAGTGFYGSYLFQVAADIVWLPHPDYSCAVKEIVDHPLFFERYDFYPGLYDYGIALRKDSPRHAELTQLLTQEVRQIYGGLDPAQIKATLLAR